jgi:hypothetical protein
LLIGTGPIELVFFADLCYFLGREKKFSPKTGVSMILPALAGGVLNPQTE